MADRLLNRQAIAEILSTGPGVAMAELAKYGCHPIDLGRGARRGLRWFESDVIRAMRLMRMEARPMAAPAKRKKQKAPQSGLNLTRMSVNEVQAMLTNASPVQ